MSKSKIHQSVNPKATSPRNAFGIGYSTLFTSPAGLLLPSYVEDVKAGDKIKLSLSSITRTRPVNTAAFMSFDEKTDFWFVPYRLLWSDYSNWRLSTNIRRNTYDLYNVGSQVNCPYTTWQSIADYFESVNNEGNDGYYTLSNASLSFALRQLDLLGYSNPPLENVYNYVRDSDCDLYPKTNGSTAMYISQFYQGLNETCGTPVNYFRLAAYQCIYMAHYRNEEYESMDPSYYNTDNLYYNKLYGTSAPDNTAPSIDPVVNDAVLSKPNRLSGSTLQDQSNANGGFPNYLSLYKLFTPRYKNRRKDIYTNLKPTNLQSGVIFQVPQGSIGNSFNSTDPHDENTKYILDQPYESEPNSYFPKLDLQNTNNKLFANNIRLLFAQDKFARQSLYSDKDYKHLMKSLFGVDVPEPNVPRYLGTHSSNISVNEIVASSTGEATINGNSTSSVLGELSGKGFQSSDGFVFEDSFNEDGIVMGIHYIMPRNNYDSYRVNKFNTKLSRFDYYYPVFDGLGFSPVFLRELRLSEFYTANQNTDPTNRQTKGSTLIGYAPRYYEFKERQNEVHGVFQTNQCEENWTLTNLTNSATFGSDPILFKILPNVTDKIFTLNYDGSQPTDPFMCYFNYDVTRISNMEVLGIPNL